MMRRLPLILFIATLAVGPQLLPEFTVTLLNYIGLYAIVALGLVLLTGVGGLTSFGQAAFAKGEARWLSAPGLGPGLKSGAIRGFGIYGSTTAEYSYFNGATARLWVKYAK